VVVVFYLTLRASFGRLEDAHLHVKKVDRLYTSTVETLAMAIDAKDDVTHNHVRRVQASALALARALGIADESELKAIEAAALLHDTGKLAVPEHILNKPGGLNEAEFEQMKRHVNIGADILSLVEFPYPVVPIVRCHHEAWDGSGYPNGIAGTDIPIGARILSVVDCYDALMSDRPYRKRMTDAEAVAIIQERSGRMYDPTVVDMFVKIHLDIAIADESAPTHEVFQQIARSHHPEQAAAAHEPVTSAAATATPSDDALAFVSLARLASGAVDVSDVLALSTNLLGRFVPNASGAWFTLKETGDRLIVAEAFGPAAHVLRHLNFGVSEKLTGWVAAHRKVIVNSDPALDLGDLSARCTPALKSCLSVPLCAGPKLIGVLSLYSDQREAFTADQGRLIEMVAPHIAQAIQTAGARSQTPNVQPALRRVSRS
jgi:putative nucleotidyltransferase with HDIG domain